MHGKGRFSGSEQKWPHLREWLEGEDPALRWMAQQYLGTDELAGLDGKLDPAWPRTARSDPEAAFWELYVAASLRDRGNCLMSVSGKGLPDVCANASGHRVWVEAVCPRPGNLNENKDTVPDFPAPGVASQFPMEQVVLRVNSVLRDKLKQYKHRIAKRRICPRDAYVIAVNGLWAAHGRVCNGPEVAQRAVFGLGPCGVLLDRETLEPRGTFIEDRPVRHRAGGAEVLGFFRQPNTETEGISAIIYDERPIYVPPGTSPLGCGFFTLHNPTARVPLPADFPGIGTQLRWNERAQQLETYPT